MRYETVQCLSEADLKRSTGVYRSTSDKMRYVIERNFGRPPKLSRADQLLLSANRLYVGRFKRLKIRLWKSEQFNLSNKKELQTSSIELEIFLVDATDQPVERPQKNSGSNMFCCSLMQVIRAWLKYIPTARHRPEKPNCIRYD